MGYNRTMPETERARLLPEVCKYINCTIKANSAEVSTSGDRGAIVYHSRPGQTNPDKLSVPATDLYSGNKDIWKDDVRPWLISMHHTDEISRAVERLTRKAAPLPCDSKGEHDCCYMVNSSKEVRHAIGPVDAAVSPTGEAHRWGVLEPEPDEPQVQEAEQSLPD